MLANMAVESAFDSRLLAIEAMLEEIQDAIDQVRTDLDGYTYQPIDPVETAIGRFMAKIQESDSDVMSRWLVDEVQRAVALRNE